MSLSKEKNRERMLKYRAGQRAKKLEEYIRVIAREEAHGVISERMRTLAWFKKGVLDDNQIAIGQDMADRHELSDAPE